MHPETLNLSKYDDEMEQLLRPFAHSSCFVIQLVQGVLWLVRNGRSYVDTSLSIENMTV